MINWIYQDDDLEFDEVLRFEKSLSERYLPLARRIGFDFRLLRAGEITVSCLDGPVMRYRGEDLLATRQCYIAEDISMAPQGLQHMRAIYRTIEASDSVLLNRSISGPDYLERDKLALLQYAAGLGVPTIGTLAVPAGKYARQVIPEVQREFGSGPYIIKPRELGMGVGVLKVESDQQLTSAIDIVSTTGTGYIVQPFLPHRADMRVFIVDGRVVTSLSRKPRPGGYLASISQGGSLEVNDDHLQVEEMCHRIGRNLDAQFLCVDWLMTDSGPVLNEWSTASAGFTLLPEPQLTVLSDAFFGWIKRTIEDGA
ncbi:RimK family alpha-L-glutamate ligase [Streptacidiphilus sp. MAP12-33]|uniref:ATP-grasp domain-containing protein n=1 Tax=Streptacidiphilus sp. MAP12-33 TaxID=3156266 RepID=UPI003516882A